MVCRREELREQAAEHAQDYDHRALVAMPWGVEWGEAEQSTLAIIEAMRPGAA